jgi:hypothetical protein
MPGFDFLASSNFAAVLGDLSLGIAFHWVVLVRVGTARSSVGYGNLLPERPLVRYDLMDIRKFRGSTNTSSTLHVASGRSRISPAMRMLDLNRKS